MSDLGEKHEEYLRFSLWSAHHAKLEITNLLKLQCGVTGELTEITL